MKQLFLSTLPLTGLIAGCTSQTVDTSAGKQLQDEKPNVILFLTDDQGFGDLSLHGNPHLNTQNIDAFARKGVQFSNFYVCPACAPTRAGLLTGRYNFRTKNTDVGDTTCYMSPDEITIAEVLKANGYLTGMYGKWHLGEIYPLNPGNQGFDEVVFHHFCNITRDFPVDNSYFDPYLFHNGKLKKYNGYCMDVYTNEAIRLMERAKKEDKPFFIYLPTTLAHVPLQVSEEYYKPFMEQGISEETARAYGMIQSIDKNFGRLLGKLQEMKMRDNTLVIYTSDNGQSSHDLDRYHANLRGLKGFMYEGGVKVPCFMQFPNGIKSPVKVSHPTAYIDVMPTILDYCDIPNPLGITIDGRSWAPLVDEQESGWTERNIFIQWRIDMPMDPYRHIMVRNNRYKMVQEDASGHSQQRLNFHYRWCKEHDYNHYTLTNGLDFELYDLANDPFEKNNVADEHPEMIEEMKREYLAWHREVFSTRGHNRPVLKLNSRKQNPVYLTSNFWLAPRAWEMVVETPGTFDVTVHWGNLKAKPEKLHTEIAGKHYEAVITKKKGEHTFKNVSIPSGYQKIQSWVNNKQTKLSITTVIKKN